MTMRVCPACHKPTANGKHCQQCGTALPLAAGGNSGDIYAKDATVVAGSTLMGDVAISALMPLVKCLICGKRNKPVDTFQCATCGRDHLCVSHQDPVTFLCAPCTRGQTEALEQAERAAREAARRAARERLLRILPSADADRLDLALGPGVGMSLMRVRAGAFLMGSDPAKDALASDDERPQHTLSLPEFWIGKTEVTAGHFGAYLAATGAATRARGAADARANHPVVDVSWDDCLAFCAWASAVTGLPLDLPSEAEWETAARGPDGRIHPWGNAPADATRLNFYSHVDATTPVGEYGARGRSPYGCDDMAGNVWEWTRSLWGRQAAKPEFGYPYSTRQAEREDLRAGRDVRRVLRGGSFNNLARDVRCASRHADVPGASGDRRGFRVVMRLSAE